VKLRCGGRALDVRLEKGAALFERRRVLFRQTRSGGELSAVEIDGKVSRLRTVRSGGRVSVWCDGEVYEFTPEGAGAVRTAEHAGDLLSPMPGRVRRTLLKAGDAVKRGEVVMIVEAMKMEHAIRAPRDGVLTRIAHGEGDLVEAGVALAEIASGDIISS